MNGYVRAFLTVPNAFIKLGFIKLFHPKGLKFGSLARISCRTEISMEQKSELHIGKRFNMRSGSKIRIRKNAKLLMGNNVSISHNCIIACHERIEIGNDAQIAPGVLIYDHDHDFRAEGGVKSGKYITAPVKIGNNVWIGANTIILRGTTIGDNCVIAAGSVIKGDIPTNSIVVQKRETTISMIGNNQ